MRQFCYYTIMVLVFASCQSNYRPVLLGEVHEMIAANNAQDQEYARQSTASIFAVLERVYAALQYLGHLQQQSLVAAGEEPDPELEGLLGAAAIAVGEHKQEPPAPAPVVKPGGFSWGQTGIIAAIAFGVRVLSKVMPGDPINRVAELVTGALRGTAGLVKRAPEKPRGEPFDTPGTT